MPDSTGVLRDSSLQNTTSPPPIDYGGTPAHRLEAVPAARRGGVEHGAARAPQVDRARADARVEPRGEAAAAQRLLRLGGEAGSLRPTR